LIKYIFAHLKGGVVVRVSIRLDGLKIRVELIEMVEGKELFKKMVAN
jgi:hypothetical protein